MSDNPMYDTAVRQIDRLEAEVERLRALNTEMARALERARGLISGNGLDVDFIDAALSKHSPSPRRCQWGFAP